MSNLMDKHTEKGAHRRIKAMLTQAQVVPVIRTQSQEAAMWLALGLLKRGVSVLELTLSIPNVQEVLAACRKAFPEAVYGLGTVMTPEDLQTHQTLSVDFWVSPVMNPALIQAAQEDGVFLIPASSTPTEVFQAVTLGCDWVKLFPIASLGGQAGGSALVKSLSAVFPSVTWMPTGGVSLETASDYLSQLSVGCVGVGQGGCKAEVLAKRDETALDALATRLLGFSKAMATVTASNSFGEGF